MIIREPGQTASRRCKNRVSLVDLYPTFNEMFGLDPNPNRNSKAPALDGESLIPLLSDGGPDELGENLANIPTTKNALEKHGSEIGPAHFTLHRDKIKYSLFGNGEEELYDLDADPFELHNLADDAEWIQQKAQMRETLLARTPDWFLNVKAGDWESRKWHCR